MSFAAVAGAVISVGGSMAAANQAKKGAQGAANAQAAAQQAAIDEQRRQYDLTREDMAPWRQAGAAALNRLTDPAASFAASPGYQFALDQGQQAVERARSATGNLASGNTLAELTRYGQGMANQEYGNWWNQQSGLAGAGQNATNNLAALGQETSANIGNAMAEQGDARASGIATGANAWGNALGTAAGYGADLVGSGINSFRKWNNNRLLSPVTITAKPAGWTPPIRGM